MSWLAHLVARLRGAPSSGNTAAAGTPSGPDGHLADGVAGELDLVEDGLLDQELLLQHARRRLADLGVSARLHEQSGGSIAPLQAASAELRAAIDQATDRVGDMRIEVQRLRASALSASARLEMHEIMRAFDAASNRVRDALARADDAVMSLQAQAHGQDEL